MLTNPKPNKSKFTTLLILPDHMEDYHKIPKQEAFRELFLSENDFQTYSSINFPEKNSDFGGLETN